MSVEAIEPAVTVGESGDVRVGCTATEQVSLAYYENATPLFREIVVANPSDQDLVDLAIWITRLTNAFSKKFENHAHMVALYTV